MFKNPTGHRIISIGECGQNIFKPVRYYTIVMRYLIPLQGHGTFLKTCQKQHSDVAGIQHQPYSSFWCRNKTTEYFLQACLWWEWHRTDQSTIFKHRFSLTSASMKSMAEYGIDGITNWIKSLEIATAVWSNWHNHSVSSTNAEILGVAILHVNPRFQPTPAGRNLRLTWKIQTPASSAVTHFLICHPHSHLLIFHINISFETLSSIQIYR